MPGPAVPSPAVERLASWLLDPGVDPELAGELTAWLGESPGFRAFAETYRDKIRKKLRSARDPESRRDVRAELAVARLLLAERGVALEFEASGSQQLGPDFTLTVGAARVNLEVTRMRRPPVEPSVAAAVLAKLRQFPTGAANVLLLAVSSADALGVDPGAAVRSIRTRADAKDEAFFAGRGFAGTRGFYDRLLRLGAVIAWAETQADAARVAVWVNPSARIAVPPRALRRIERSLAGR